MDQQEEDDVDVCGGGEETLPALPPSSSSYSLAEIQNVPVIEQSKKGGGGAKSLLSKKRPLKIDSDDTASDDGLDAQSRKQKSLGLLCQRFLTAMGDASRKGNEIHLESVARKMAVEKRRIYDIVNVMEALEAMSKTNKSFYQWNGLRYLPQLMAQLQKDALAEGLPNRVAAVELAMCNFTELAKSRGRTLATEIVGTMVTDKNDDNDSGYFAGGAGGYSPDDDKENNFHAKSRQVEEEKANNNRSSSSSVRFSRDRNGRNSLAQLCRRFLMVLLCNPNNKRQVSLDVASTVLIKDPDSENIEPPSRSRCRRLYDIANVLVAMGLIKKVHYLFGTKKIPLFVYSGPEPDQNGKLEPYDPETFVEQTHTAEEDNYVAKKKLALAAARSAPRDDIKPKSSITRFEQRSASLMDICEIAERERMRLIAGDDAENENVISMAVVQSEKSKPTVKPKAKFIRQSSATTTTSNHRKYVVRIGDTYHISPNPASITTVGLNSNNSPTLSPTTGTIRRSVSSTTTSPYHQHRYLLNTSPYPPSGMFIPPSISSTITSTSSSPFRQINHPTVAHSVNSILSNHNHRQGPVQYRIVPPPMLPAFRTGTMSLCKDGLYRDILLPESAD